HSPPNGELSASPCSAMRMLTWRGNAATRVLTRSGQPPSPIPASRGHGPVSCAMMILKEIYYDKNKRGG
ncbi:hypothetical protein BDN72DRAFT_838924, partial [Pluteus cervinus]